MQPESAPVAGPARAALPAEALVGELSGEVGPEGVTAGPDVDLAGVRPAVRVTPGSVERLAAILALASRRGWGVCPSGAGSKLDWGNPPRRADLLVCTRDLSSVAELDPEDLSVSVRAGTPVATLTAAARAAGVVAPLDPEMPAWATVGGVAAANDQGARRLRYGGLRDVVLGMTAVLADGTRVKFGGRTMKNVTGYDLTKLFVGSLGVLGVITEVTFRLLPRPVASAVVALQFGTLEQVAELATGVLDSVLEPVALEVLSPAAGPLLDPTVAASLGLEAAPPGLDAAPFDPHATEPHYTLLAGFEGHPAAVERSANEMVRSHRALVPRGRRGVLRASEAANGPDHTPAGSTGSDPIEAVYGSLADLRRRATLAGLPLVAKATSPPAYVWSLARAAEVEAAAAGAPFAYRISAGSGILQLYLGAGAGPARTTACLEELRRQAATVGGHVVVRPGAARLNPGFDVWGDVGGSVRAMRALKARFDPAGTLNPGRFVGGI
jgi:glycolate oxidase FAD binding subunit